MSLSQLQSFVVVAEEGNVTRAAKRLAISQPPLSRKLKDLEAELGVQLLTRTAQGVTLTNHGQRFLVRARQVLSVLETAVVELRTN